MKITKRILKNGIIEYHNEKKEYHREDGPAVELNGDKIWFYNGKQNRFYSQEYLKQRLQPSTNIYKYIIDNVADDLDPGETFLLRLVIANHFPDYLNFLDKLLILQ